jgi:hypothetical protein
MDGEALINYLCWRACLESAQCARPTLLSQPLADQGCRNPQLVGNGSQGQPRVAQTTHAGHITPDLVERTPVVEPSPEPEKVVFTPAQQAKIDEIIKGVTGRTASELRRENAKLRNSLDSALKASSPDATELDRVRAELDGAKLRLEDMASERANALLESEIVAAAHSEGFVDSQQATLLLDKSSFVKQDGSLDIEAAKAAVRTLANKSPHLVRSTAKSGSGSGPDQRMPPPVSAKLESLFGRGSNAAEANHLALTNPAAYKTMRLEARKRGLI